MAIKILPEPAEASSAMADNSIRHGYVTIGVHRHEVTWHSISKEVYVYSRNWWYAGEAYDFTGALDTAVSFMRSKGWS
jgi:hypothetical protein